MHVHGGTEDNGFALDVMVQDQTSDRLSLFLAETLRSVISMSGTAKDAETFNITTDGGAPVVGNFICLQENGKITQEEITAVTPVAGDEYTITIAVPLDYDYTSEGGCVIQNANINVDGSVADRIFQVQPTGDYKWDITRMMISMLLATTPDDGKFGDQTALTSGQYFRKEDSADSQNLFIVKDNNDFAVEGYDLNYVDRTVPAGSHGLRARITFNGPDKSGVVIRLDGNTGDNFRTVIRDDLTGLTKYRIKVQGHVVEE